MPSSARWCAHSEAGRVPLPLQLEEGFQADTPLCPPSAWEQSVRERKPKWAKDVGSWTVKFPE